MPITSFNGALSNIDNDSATFTFSFTSNGFSTVNYNLIATPSGGGAPITLATAGFAYTNGADLNNQVVSFSYPTANLPAGNYSFSVQGTQNSSAGVGSPFTAAPAVTNVPIICFLRGTMIATPAGQVAVETLSRGDLVMTADGRAVPVLWLGQQSVSTVFGMNETTSPVRIAAGALGQGLPLRDLRVTAGHALLLDGVLVNAGALVNGTTITRIGRAELGETFTVFHVETEHHEIILAEGAASETYIDNGSRARFDNHAEFVELFGAEGRIAVELHQPRAMSPRQVPAAVAARIAAQATSVSAKAA